MPTYGQVNLADGRRTEQEDNWFYKVQMEMVGEMETETKMETKFKN
jgi:hypothetical protein